MPDEFDNFFGGSVASPTVARVPRVSFDPVQRIKERAPAYGVPEDLALKVLHQESGGNQYRKGGGVLTSYKGAKGLMQVLPATGRKYGYDVNDSEQNVEAGLSYLGDSYKRWKGNPALTVAGYHAGIEDAEKALRNPRGNPKTHNYVRSILGDNEYGKAVGQHQAQPTVDEFDSFFGGHSPALKSQSVSSPVDDFDTHFGEGKKQVATPSATVSDPDLIPTPQSALDYQGPPIEPKETPLKLSVTQKADEPVPPDLTRMTGARGDYSANRASRFAKAGYLGARSFPASDIQSALAGGKIDRDEALRQVNQRAAEEIAKEFNISPQDAQQYLKGFSKPEEVLANLKYTDNPESRGHFIYGLPSDYATQLDQLKKLKEYEKLSFDEKRAKAYEIARQRPLTPVERKALGYEGGFARSFENYAETLSTGMAKSVAEAASGAGRMTGLKPLQELGDIGQEAAKERLNILKPEGVGGAVAQGLGEIGTDIAGTTLVPGSAAAHRLYWMGLTYDKAIGRGATHEEAMKEAATAGAILEAGKPLAPLTGAVGEGVGGQVVKTGTRAALGGSLGYGLARAQGASSDEALAQGIQFGGMSASGGARAAEEPIGRVAPSSRTMEANQAPLKTAETAGIDWQSRKFARPGEFVFWDQGAPIAPRNRFTAGPEGVRDFRATNPREALVPTGKSRSVSVEVPRGVERQSPIRVPISELQPQAAPELPQHYSNYQPRDEVGQFIEGRPEVPQEVISEKPSQGNVQRPNQPAVASQEKPPAFMAERYQPQQPNLTRNFRAGSNDASMTFANENQKDLYDLGAKMRYAGRGGQNKTSQRPVGDIVGLRRSLVNRLGVDEATVSRMAMDTHSDVREQMKGVKHLEERQLADNAAVPQKTVTIVKPSAPRGPIKKEGLTGAVLNLGGINPSTPEGSDFAKYLGGREGGRPGALNKRGLGVDEMLTRLETEGYHFEDQNQLLDALRKEQQGHRIYSTDHDYAADIEKEAKAYFGGEKQVHIGTYRDILNDKELAPIVERFGTGEYSDEDGQAFKQAAKYKHNLTPETTSDILAEAAANRAEFRRGDVSKEGVAEVGKQTASEADSARLRTAEGTGDVEQGVRLTESTPDLDEARQLLAEAIAKTRPTNSLIARTGQSSGVYDDPSFFNSRLRQNELYGTLEHGKQDVGLRLSQASLPQYVQEAREAFDYYEMVRKEAENAVRERQNQQSQAKTELSPRLTTTQTDRVRELHKSLLEQGKSVDDYLRNQSLFAESALSPAQAELLRELDKGQARTAKPKTEQPSFNLEAPAEEPPKGSHGSFINALFKSPDIESGKPAFLANTEVRKALGLKDFPAYVEGDKANAKARSAAMTETKDALAKALDKPRSSHILPEELKQWASDNGLTGHTVDALDTAHAQYRAKQTKGSKLEAFATEKPVPPGRESERGILSVNLPSKQQVTQAVQTAKDKAIPILKNRYFEGLLTPSGAVRVGFGLASHEAMSWVGNTIGKTTDAIVKAVTGGERAFRFSSPSAVWDAITDGVWPGVKSAGKTLAGKPSEMHPHYKDTGGPVLGAVTSPMRRLYSAKEALFKGIAAGRAGRELTETLSNLNTAAQTAAITKYTDILEDYHNSKKQYPSVLASMRYRQQLMTDPDFLKSEWSMMQAEKQVGGNPNAVASALGRVGKEGVSVGGVEIVKGDSLPAKTLQGIINVETPFLKRPANHIATVVGDYMGVNTIKDLSNGKITSYIQNTLSIPEQQAVLKSFGRGAVGWGVMGLGFFLAGHGSATGVLNEDKNKFGGAIKIGGKWIQVGHIPFFGWLFTAGATMREVLDEGFSAGNLAKGSWKMLSEHPGLRALQTATDTVASITKGTIGAGEGLKEHAAQVVSRVAIPSPVASVAQLTDRNQEGVVQRKTRGEGVAAQFKSRIPGLRSSLPAQVDQEGSTRTASYFNPFPTRKENEIPSLAEQRVKEHVKEQMPQKEFTPEDRERGTLKKSIVDKIKAGDVATARSMTKEAIKAGKISKDEAGELGEKAKLDILQYDVKKHYSLKDALELYYDKSTSDAERQRLAPIIADKMMKFDDSKVRGEDLNKLRPQAKKFAKENQRLFAEQ